MINTGYPCLFPFLFSFPFLFLFPFPMRVPTLWDPTLGPHGTAWFGLQLLGRLPFGNVFGKCRAFVPGKCGEHYLVPASGFPGLVAASGFPGPVPAFGSICLLRNPLT